MTYEELVEQLVSEGAIRLYRVSEGWGFAYRLKEGRLQARSFNSQGGDGGPWTLRQHLVGVYGSAASDGWHTVKDLPPDAEPIGNEEAKDNPGYYADFKRQCVTCKKFKPLPAFERQVETFKGYRTWECNECYDIRRQEVEMYAQLPDRRVGDYITRDTHASRPPVEGEL